MSIELANEFIRTGCDKAAKHHYHLVYGEALEQRKSEKLNILEIGIFKGDSTRAFLNYLPYANFYGVDIFDRVEKANIDIHNHPRVNWIKSDSTSEDLPSLIEDTWGDIKFDYIIDDGAHWHEAQRLTFENCFPFLKDDGVYWIEDVWPMHIMNEQQKRHPWITSETRRDKYTIEENKKLLDELNKYNFKEIDHRYKTGQPDSYIYEVRK